MATLTKQKPYTRIGVNSTPTSRTGSPSSWIYVPLDLGGLALGGTVEAEELELERADPGLTHLLLTTRNGGKGKVGFPLYPENISTLLNMAIGSAGALPSYHTIEQYLNADLGASFDAGTDTGKILSGVLGDGFSFSFDRKQLGSLRLSLDAYVNADASTEAAAPDPAGLWPAQDPYTGKRVMVDLDLANNSQTLNGWTGDYTSMRSMSVNFQNGIEVDLHRADESSDALDGTWTQAYPGTPRAALQFKLIADSAKHLDLLRLNSGLRKCAFRVAGYGANPSGNTTCAASLTAGSAVVVEVAASTGFAVNDYVLLWQPTANKFAVGKVTVIQAGPARLTIDTLDVTMDGTSETIKVRNTAWEMKISDARIRTATQPTLEGNVYVVDVTADAIVGPSATSAVVLKAYNDNNA